jgi:uncharacterized OsmC-like protein
MSTIATKDGAALLSVIPRRGEGLQAGIRGHMLELSDPTDHLLAPAPDDLLVASLASELAWSARTLLRASGLADDVSVSAEWRTTEHLPRLADINLTVTVSKDAEAVSAALAAAFEKSLAERSLSGPVVRVAFDDSSRARE